MSRGLPSIFVLSVLGLLVSPAVAEAQDPDSDGVLDASDAFPCDGTRSSVTWIPGQTDLPPIS